MKKKQYGMIVQILLHLKNKVVETQEQRFQS